MSEQTDPAKPQVKAQPGAADAKAERPTPSGSATPETGARATPTTTPGGQAPDQGGDAKTADAKAGNAAATGEKAAGEGGASEKGGDENRPFAARPMKPASGSGAPTPQAPQPQTPTPQISTSPTSATQAPTPQASQSQAAQAETVKAQAPQSQTAQPETAKPQAAQAETAKPDAPGRRARAAGKAAPAERERPARVVKEQPAKPLQARAVAARQQTTLPDAPPQPKPVAKPQPGGDKAPPASPSVRAPVQAAQPQRRHWILLASFVAVVVLPTLIAAWYLWARATDQYVSTVGFSVRHEDAQPAIDLLGGLAAFGGSAAGASDTDILYQYILSADMVETVDRQLDLRTRFARQWPNDFVFAYNPEGTIEDLTDYWQRQVNVIYDSSVGLITLNVSAFDPQDAQQIAQAILDESTARINELSSIARDDATRLAREELEKARVELTAARQEMTAFRIHTQIVDPQADLAGQMGVLAGLQTQLAEQMVSHDLLMENAPPTDNRVIQSQQRIDALERLIERERAKFSQDGHGPGGESYAQLVAEFEKLTVDREFAEGAYRSARVAYESALAEAQRQSRYLAAHINPRVPQASTQPHRLRLLGLTAGLLLIAWSIMTLVYYSVRDRG